MHNSKLVFARYAGLISIVAVAGCGGSKVNAGADGGVVRTSPVVISAASPRPRIGTLSVNYWTWPTTYGNSVAGTESLVAALKPTMMRVGGYNNDANLPDPFNDAEFDRMIAYARAIGADPIVQVPLLQDNDGKTPTGATAAAMVAYANVTRSYDVRYFSIGNEPDLYTMQGLPSNSTLPARPGYSPADYCTTARDFVTQMKAVDPTIKIVGPDLAYQYQSFADWLSPVLQGCGDLFDIIAIHRYPFSAPQATLASATADVLAFRGVISSVHGLMQAAGYGDKPLALTEMNVAYDATPAGTPPGAQPGTIPSALWLADAFGAALDLDLWTTAVWDISDPAPYALGLLDIPPSHTPRPEYYAYALYADHYGPTLVDVTSAPPGVNAYASRNAAANATELIVVNWNAVPAPLTFQVTGLAAPPSAPIFQLPALSIAAVEIPDNGAASASTYGSAQKATGSGPETLAPGASAIAGNDFADGGIEAADGPGSAPRCASVPAQTTPITTMGRAVGALLAFGSGASQWGSFAYAGPGQPVPAASPTVDGAGIQIDASFVSPVSPANNYEGVGLYYNSPSCIDASAYTGIAFDVAGDLGACVLSFGVSFSGDTSVTNDPVRGSCTLGNASCYAPASPPISAGTAIQVPFSSLTAGMPLNLIDPSTIISFQWQLSAPLGADAGGCAASFTVSNATFY